MISSRTVASQTHKYGRDHDAAADGIGFRGREGAVFLFRLGQKALALRPLFASLRARRIASSFSLMRLSDGFS